MNEAPLIQVRKADLIAPVHCSVCNHTFISSKEEWVTVVNNLYELTVPDETMCPKCCSIVDIPIDNYQVIFRKIDTPTKDDQLAKKVGGIFLKILFGLLTVSIIMFIMLLRK
jgi:hypothetical protein